MLAGTGYAMLQLQKSYRDLNRSNAELAAVNSSLEDRVISRTEELSGAYDELKDSQVQLVQAEKMSSLGELVAGISHEINTPLYYLTSNATVIQERLVLVNNFIDVAQKMMFDAALADFFKSGFCCDVFRQHQCRCFREIVEASRESAKEPESAMLMHTLWSSCQVRSAMSPLSSIASAAFVIRLRKIWLICDGEQLMTGTTP